MTEEEIKNEVEEWSKYMLNTIDPMSISDCLIEFEYDLKNLSDNNIAPWSSFEETKEFLEKEIQKLTILKKYAVEHNIKIVL